MSGLRPERAGSPHFWARFLVEAKITGQLEHPGIVPIYELSRQKSGQQPFYTMRFVRGRTLTDQPSVASAGKLSTVPTQKPSKSLMASFLCEVAACRVVLSATVTAGKSKFKIRSSPTSIKAGQKAKIAMKLSKKQQALIAATLKKHGKVTAAVAASIESTVGLQTTKSLAIAVRR